MSVTFFKSTTDIGVLVTFDRFPKRLFKTTAMLSFHFSTKILSGVAYSICITTFAQQLDFLFSKPRLDEVGQN